MKDRPILNTCPDEEFFFREKEIETIFRKALSTGPVPGIYLWGERKVGKSEVLKRVYHRLFREQDRVVPFYYAVRSGYSDPVAFAEDYLGTFVRQYLAFLKKTPLLAVERQPLNRLERMAAEEDVEVLSRLLSIHREGRDEKDHHLVIRNAVSSPHLFSLYYQSFYQSRVFVMIDDFHLLGDIRFPETGSLLNEFHELLRSQVAPHLITVSASPLVSGIFSGVELPEALDVIEIKPLAEEKAAGMMEELCRAHGIKYDKDVVYFAVRQLGGNPFYIKGIIRAAVKLEAGLSSLREFMNIYTYEILKGGTGLYLSSLISAMMDGKDRNSEIRALYHSLGPVRNESRLESAFIVSEESPLPDVQEPDADKVLADFVDAVYRMEIKGMSASQVRTEIAGKRLKEGYRLRPGQARVDMKEEVGGLLDMFNGQRAPRVLFQHHDFELRHAAKGAGELDLSLDEDTIMLPQMLGSFNDREGTERSGLYVVEAQGFYDGRYEDGYESAWIIGIKDTLDPLDTAETERFIERCERLKYRNKTARMVRWLVSRGGFTEHAWKLLKSEVIFSSDPSQLSMLRRVLEAEGIDGTIAGLMPLREFDLVIPMAQDAEIVAARVLEEVARKAGFDDDTVSQLKMALIEACINAFEHGRVRNGKVSVSFFVEKERLVIYVKNEGKGFDAAQVPKPDIDQKLVSHNKRGWGIELMKGLMDEIRFENINEGTKLIMVKYIKRKEEGDAPAKSFKQVRQ